jgi:plastocyanin
VQRVLLMIAAVVVGVAAIYLAAKQLQDKPEVEPAEQQVEAPGGARTVGVRMSGTAFVPDQVSIRAGQTVRWVNNDPTEHTVSAEGNFDSGNIAPDETFERVFAEQSVIDYICTIHPDQMSGSVTVVGD